MVGRVVGHSDEKSRASRCRRQSGGVAESRVGTLKTSPPGAAPKRDPAGCHRAEKLASVPKGASEPASSFHETRGNALTDNSWWNWSPTAPAVVVDPRELTRVFTPSAVTILSGELKDQQCDPNERNDDAGLRRVEIPDAMQVV